MKSLGASPGCAAGTEASWYTGIRVTLAEVARIAKRQKRSYCFTPGRIKGHEGFGLAVP